MATVVPVMVQPAAASLRERTDPAVIMLNEVDAEVRALETRLRDIEAREQDDAPRYPGTRRGPGFEVTMDHPEGTLEEDVPVYEAGPQSVQDSQPGGMYYCNTHEEGQLEEDVEVFDLGSTRPPKMTAKEAEAYRAKNVHIATGLQGDVNEEEAGAVDTDVPSYEVSGCSIM